MYPLFLNLSDRLAVVVGGGPVGQRRAAGLLAARARVRLVCLEGRPETLTDSGLDWRQEGYGAEHLEGAALVFAAAPDAVNRRVAADCRRLGVWVNVADDPEGSDFLVPATLRQGKLVIAVGTGGAAPALARAVRDQLQPQFDDAFGQWLELLAELRPLVLAAVADERQRQGLLEGWCGREWLDRLRRDGADAVRAALHAELRALVKASAAPL